MDGEHLTHRRGTPMQLESEHERRDFLRMSIASGLILILNGCGKEQAQKADEREKRPSAKSGEEAKGGEVTATEDLMREHGVLRRALLVYSEAAAKLRSSPSTVAPDALQ